LRAGFFFFSISTERTSCFCITIARPLLNFLSTGCCRRWWFVAGMSGEISQWNEK
jgi:hypothetical protein